VRQSGVVTLDKRYANTAEQGVYYQGDRTVHGDWLVQILCVKTDSDIISLEVEGQNDKSQAIVLVRKRQEDARWMKKLDLCQQGVSELSNELRTLR
jgi:hypothetical protein